MLAGEPCMHDELLGCTFAISPTSFYQTNPQQTEVLYQLAIDGMALQPNDVLVDAYCGSGTIGLCAAHAAAQSGTPVHLLGIEQNESGVAERAAQCAAQRPHAGAGDLRCRGCHPPTCGKPPARARATTWWRSIRRAPAPRPPSSKPRWPRSPRRIVYISCNPVTQARDLEVLGTGGYRLLRLTPVDMFPHTEHVETVAVLARA